MAERVWGGLGMGVLKQPQETPECSRMPQPGPELKAGRGGFRIADRPPHQAAPCLAPLARCGAEPRILMEEDEQTPAHLKASVFRKTALRMTQPVITPSRQAPCLHCPLSPHHVIVLNEFKFQGPQTKNQAWSSKGGGPSSHGPPS